MDQKIGPKKATFIIYDSSLYVGNVLNRAVTFEILEYYSSVTIHSWRV